MAAKIFDKNRMLASTIKIVAIIIIVVFVVLWFLGGGVGKIVNSARSFHLFSFSDLLTGSTTLSTFQLPWQGAIPAVDVSPVYMPGDQGASASPPSHSSYANASPYAGDVAILEGAARAQAASGQYIELRAQPGLGAPVRISGWSLESALTGVRAYLPQASTKFLQNRINPVVDAVLLPGEGAIVQTGASPVGVSFKENMCTGYLGTLQPFAPSLDRSCPSPQTSIPRTAENESLLGASCFDYLATLPFCTFPTSLPSTLSSACRDTIQNRLSYNGCVQQYGNTTSFARDTWRLFLAHGTPLWSGEHDVIRLLDGQGRVVDVLNY